MFLTPLELRADRKPGHWILLRDLIWHGAQYVVVPKGFVTDLASIPRGLRWLLQQNGNSRRAAVLHDFLYATQPFTRAEADGIFRAALKAERVVGIGRGLYWAGVRVGGWLPWRRKSK